MTAPVTPVPVVPVAPAAPVIPDPPAGTPSWLTHLVTLAVAGVPVVLAWWRPKHVLSTPDAQAAVVIAGLTLAIIIHAVKIILANRLDKAGIEKDAIATESWVRDNSAEIKTLFVAAKPALDAIPGVPAGLAEAQREIAEIQAKLDALPAAQEAAAKAAIASVFATPPAA